MLAKFQNLIVPALQPEASFVPSAETATAQTLPRCSGLERGLFSCVKVSQTATDLSRPPLTNLLPKGEKANEPTPPSWACQVEISRPDSTSRSWIFPSLKPRAAIRRSAEISTQGTL